MSTNFQPSTTPGTRTAITCTKCGKAASVPFTPTPGRPVFCRDCFSRPAPGAAGPGAGNARGPSRGGFFNGPPRATEPRKRMLAQGRKTHFVYDAKAVFESMPGGSMDDKDQRAFLEGLFARGARQSTLAAQEFLDEKVAHEQLTVDQRNAIGRLLERYSFYR